MTTELYSIGLLDDKPELIQWLGSEYVTNHYLNTQCTYPDKLMSQGFLQSSGAVHLSALLIKPVYITLHIVFYNFYIFTICKRNRSTYLFCLTECYLHHKYFFKKTCTILTTYTIYITKWLTLNVWGPSYLDLTRSISWLLKPWLLTSPGHQQPWYWLYRICRPCSFLGTISSTCVILMWRDDTKCKCMPCSLCKI